MTSSPPHERPYGGESASERRSARQRRLMTAVLDLVDENGIGALTVGVVCERAAVSKRHFYECFDNLDDAAGRTLSDVLGGVATRIGAVSDGVGTPDDDAVLIDATVRAVLAAFEDRRVARLYLEAPGNVGLRLARDRAVDQFVDRFLEVLAADHAGSPRARLIARVLVSGTTEVVAMWLRGTLDLPREEVVEPLVTLGTSALDRIRRPPV